MIIKPTSWVIIRIKCVSTSENAQDNCLTQSKDLILISKILIVFLQLRKLKLRVDKLLKTLKWQIHL